MTNEQKAKLLLAELHIAMEGLAKADARTYSGGYLHWSAEVTSLAKELKRLRDGV